MDKQSKKDMFDDMNEYTAYSEYSKRQRTLRIIVSSVMALIIIAAVLALLWMIRSPGSGRAEQGDAVRSESRSDTSSQDQERSAGEADSGSAEAAESNSESERIGDLIEKTLRDSSRGNSADSEISDSEANTAGEQRPDSSAAAETGESAAADGDAASTQSNTEEFVPGTGLREETEEDTRQGASRQVQFTAYIVQEDDTVSSIANAYNLKPQTIIGVNLLTENNSLVPGMRLRIPDRDGHMYIIKPGDSLSAIAHQYDMGYLTLAEINGLNPNAIIYPGDELFIPKINITENEALAVTGDLFVWPADGEVTALFGTKEDPITAEMIDYPGIDISNSTGTSVKASMGGQVEEIFHEITGYGKYVVIRNGEYRTLYAHLDEILVEQGQTVEQGQKIGEMGNTGRSLDPHLFFSIEKDGTPVDPLSLLKREDPQPGTENESETE